MGLFSKSGGDYRPEPTVTTTGSDEGYQDVKDWGQYEDNRPVTPTSGTMNEAQLKQNGLS